MRWPVRGATLTLMVLLAAWVWQQPVHAHHGEFQYKFPCYDTTISNAPPSPCYVTSIHGNYGLDFDPLGSAGLGNIASMSEGNVTFTSTFQSSCSWPNQNGFGQHVIVSDIFGRSNIYAHLSSVSVSQGAQLLQGDQVGVEGNSGYTISCAPHLHWEPGSLPQYIDGLAVSGLTAGPTDYGWAISTSVIGEYSTYGLTLRSYYQAHGGWSSLGWTYSHCPPTCTLNMFDNMSWGRMQDFRAHADAITGGEFHTIQVPVWDQNNAFLVDRIFWFDWAIGGLSGMDLTGPRKPLSMALEDRNPNCPQGSDQSCVSFQQFRLGFVWMGAFTARQSVFCPDMEMNGNRTVDLSDALYVLEGFGNVDPWRDVNGDGSVDLNDTLEILNQFGRT